MPRPVPLAGVHRRRLATQRLTAAPMRGATDVVRHLAVQSQDAPSPRGPRHALPPESYAAVLAEQAGLGFVRTHVLRPTWHHVAAEDLRWLQALTGPRIESGQAARHRALGLDTAAKDRALTTLR